MAAGIRMPAVAGSFYPADPGELAAEINRSIAPASEPRRATGCVVPHAGYMYCGHVAGAVYSAISIPDVCLVLGPDHFARGAPVAINTAGGWITPLGEARIDERLAQRICDEAPMVREDWAGQAEEHSIEVQLPFLQRLAPRFTFVPLCVRLSDDEKLEELGRALARAIAADGRGALLIASSDMNHYEPDSITREKDQRAMERILALDGRGLHQVLRRDRNTMCGYGPVIAMLAAARELGANSAALVRYATSAEAENGRRDSVVGYAGIIVNESAKTGLRLGLDAR